jgi:hypothetical protein
MPFIILGVGGAEAACCSRAHAIDLGPVSVDAG